MRDLPPGADRARALPEFPADASELVARALAEDLRDGDVTAAATIPADARARALIRQKAPGVVYGIAYAELAFHALDPDARVRSETPEGVWRESGPVLEARGS
ncbi:MAG TPA: nicotinate-nucleotide diphosphorylase (carboxylating), partial [Conexibacter sp.]|nr:nicotinate-nucleotide diphosphorylase (carboxylating) [Conexibacter sp.]